MFLFMVMLVDKIKSALEGKEFMVSSTLFSISSYADYLWTRTGILNENVREINPILEQSIEL